jgi:hypothetical protein
MNCMDNKHAGRMARAAKRKHPLKVSLLDSCIVIHLRQQPSKRACRLAFSDLSAFFDVSGRSLRELRYPSLVVPALVSVAQVGVSIGLLREMGWTVEVEDRRAEPTTAPSPMNHQTRQAKDAS